MQTKIENSFRVFSIFVLRANNRPVHLQFAPINLIQIPIRALYIGKIEVEANSIKIKSAVFRIKIRIEALIDFHFLLHSREIYAVTSCLFFLCNNFDRCSKYLVIAALSHYYFYFFCRRFTEIFLKVFLFLRNRFHC